MTSAANLRDENPMIDSDLELIIETFERSMVKSKDEDSVLAILPRQLSSLKVIPNAILRTADMPPSRSQNVGNYPESKGQATAPNVGPIDNITDPTEEGEEDEDFKDLAKKWANECIPCDLRKFTVPEVDFFEDLEEGYDNALGVFEDALDNVESLADGGLDNLWDTGGSEGNPFDTSTGGSGSEFFSQFCDIGDSLKNQCVPDLDKLKFILSMLLERNELEILPNLNILDSLITQAITPLINQLLANISMFLDIGIGPIQCVVNHLQREIERVTDGVANTRDQISNAADNIRSSRNRPSNSTSQSPAGGEESAAELAARGRAESARRSQEQADVLPNATRRVSEAIDGVSGNGAGMQRLKGLIQQGIDYIRQKARWLSGLFEELVGNGIDDLNSRVRFGRGKVNILRYLAIIDALINAAQDGDFPCGPQTESGFDEKTLTMFIQHYAHPSASLNVTLENGILSVQRTDGGVTPEASLSNESIDDEVEFENIVFTQPISSCLRKVTGAEASQVEQWIRQLD